MQDLFENIPALPAEIQSLCCQMSDDCENNDPYEILPIYLQKFESRGYTFDYDLSGTPFDLQRI